MEKKVNKSFLSKRTLEIAREICDRSCCDKCVLRIEVNHCVLKIPVNDCMLRMKVMCDYIGEINTACDKYEEEHKHTYLKEFRKRFPKALMSDSDIMDLSIAAYYGKNKDCDLCTKYYRIVDRCHECWNKEYMEEI